MPTSSWGQALTFDLSLDDERQEVVARVSRALPCQADAVLDHFLVRGVRPLGRRREDLLGEVDEPREVAGVHVQHASDDPGRERLCDLGDEVERA